MNESLVKYLAGLLDADGSLFFQFNPINDRYNIILRLNLTAASRIDKHSFLEELTKYFGHTSYSTDRKYKMWQVAKRADLEMLLPRLIKHMIVKAKHWQWLLETWREFRGGNISADQKIGLQEQSKKSRAENAGPIKAKNHPTWAWVAGYLDGDGHYSFHRWLNKKTGYTRWIIGCGAVSHINDKCALEFLQKAFGGHISVHSKTCTHVLRWYRAMGKADASFALNFLPNIVVHSRLKKHIVESIIHHHRQRLSALTSTEEAIV